MCLKPVYTLYYKIIHSDVKKRCEEAATATYCLFERENIVALGGGRYC